MKNNRKRGFTLTELIVVIAIIAVLAAVLIPGIVGYINKAKMSNDDFLIKQLNQVLEIYKIEATETEYDNTVSSAANIRHLLKEFNIDELKPSSNDNIFCFDEEQDKFVIITNDDLENNQILLADGNEAIKLADNPSSFDAIIDKHLIVSIDGHPLARVVYQLYNMNATTNLNSLLDTVSQNEKIKQQVEELLTTSVVVSENNKYITVSKNETGELIITETTEKPTDVEAKNKLLVGENVTELNLDNINGLGNALTDSFLAASIVIPNHVEVVTCSQVLTSSVFITGNIASIDQASLTTIKGSSDVVITENVQSAKGTWKAFNDKKNINNFSELTMALKAAQPGAEITIKAQEMNVTTNIEIPAGVTVIVPLSGESNASSIDGTTLNSKRMATEDLKYSDLIINRGITVTVRGQLIVAGVIGYPGQFYQGHTSGAYGQITCNGQIRVQNEGVLDVYGFIKGSGTVEAVSGGTIKEPFIVSDFSGGSNTQKLYLADQSPFSRYTMLNIQTTLIINYGAMLKGHCNLYALEGFNKIDAVIIGSDKAQANGLINLKPSSKATLTYDTTKYVVDTMEINNLDADYGLVNLTIDGGASFNALSMFILFVNISTEDVLFPLPYNYNFTLKNGTYDVCNNYILLPGSEVTVDEDATLRVIENAKLYVSEGITASAMGGKNYPTTEQLTSFGFSTVGNLIINGKLLLENTSTFGGIVQSTSNKAVIEIKDANVIASEYNLQYGAVGEYNANTSFYTLSGRVNTNGSLVNLAPNCTYYGDVSTNALLTEYNVKYLSIVSEGEQYDILINVNTPIYYAYKTETASTSLTVQGVWKQDAAEVTAQINEFKDLLTSATTYESLKELIVKYTTLSYEVKEVINNDSLTTLIDNLSNSFTDKYLTVLNGKNTNLTDSEIDLVLTGISEYDLLVKYNDFANLSDTYNELIALKEGNIRVVLVEHDSTRTYYSDWSSAATSINAITVGNVNVILLRDVDGATDVDNANLVINAGVVLSLDMNGFSWTYNSFSGQNNMNGPIASPGVEESTYGFNIFNRGILTIKNSSSNESKIVNNFNCEKDLLNIFGGCLYTTGSITSIDNVSFEGNFLGERGSFSTPYTIICLNQNDTETTTTITNVNVKLANSVVISQYVNFNNTHIVYLTNNSKIKLMENVTIESVEGIAVNTGLFLAGNAEITDITNCVIDISLSQASSSTGDGIQFTSDQNSKPNPLIGNITNTVIKAWKNGIILNSGKIVNIDFCDITTYQHGIQLNGSYNAGVEINHIANTTIKSLNLPGYLTNTSRTGIYLWRNVKINECIVEIISDKNAFQLHAESSIKISGGYFQVSSEALIIDYKVIPYTATLITSGEYNGYYQLNEEYVKTYEVPIA